MRYAGVDKDELQGCVAKYLERPWLNNAFLDWALLDAMTYCEVAAFGEAIKEAMPGPRDFFGMSKFYWDTKGDFRKMRDAQASWQLRRGLTKLGWLVGAPLGAIGLALYSRHDDWAIALAFVTIGLGILWGLITLLRKLLRIVRKPEPTFFEKSAPLYAAMSEVYELLKGPVISPPRVRQFLKDTHDKGARWYAATYPLIDRIVENHPTALSVSPHYRYAQPEATR